MCIRVFLSLLAHVALPAFWVNVIIYTVRVVFVFFYVRDGHFCNNKVCLSGHKAVILILVKDCVLKWLNTKQLFSEAQFTTVVYKTVCVGTICSSSVITGQLAISNEQGCNTLNTVSAN